MQRLIIPVLLLMALMVSSCAVITEDEIASSNAKTSSISTVSSNSQKDSLWMRSRLQSFPVSVLLMHVKETDGKYSLLLTESEALSLGIPSDLYRSVLQSLNN